ncbi:MAG TPA: hypothetical protein PKY82_10930, partial [Pyrinomonadaceae bacterium]|nr:hypothetical protein [Pyrinomonadaceae bacterium]
VFNWKGSKTNETTLSFFQTIESGTPVTSTVGFYTTSIFLHRGDLGRTPVFTQTDLAFSHKYRFGNDGKFSMALDVNLINAFDQKTVTGYFTSVSAVTLTEASLGFATPAAATNAYTSGQLLTAINTYLDGNATTLNRRDSRYKLANGYQGPRGVRFGFRFLF